MAKKRSELDNLFRENLSDYELSKKEGSWELLNHLLNEKQRKKKNIRLILFVFSFIVILSVGVFLFLNSGESNHDSSNLVLNQNEAASSPSFLNSSENENTDSLTTNVQSKENSKITENNIQQLGDENIPSKADEENSKQNLRNKNEDSHAVPESNPNRADQLSEAHEIIFDAQPNVNADDSDKTIADETEISNSIFPDEL
jgi:flagellar basal body-associated protein FliL